MTHLWTAEQLKALVTELKQRDAEGWVAGDYIESRMPHLISALRSTPVLHGEKNVQKESCLESHAQRL